VEQREVARGGAVGVSIVGVPRGTQACGGAAGVRGKDVPRGTLAHRGDFFVWGDEIFGSVETGAAIPCRDLSFARGNRRSFGCVARDEVARGAAEG